MATKERAPKRGLKGRPFMCQEMDVMQKGSKERAPRRVCQGKGVKEWLPIKRVPRKGTQERLPRKGRHFLCQEMAAKQKGAKEKVPRNGYQAKTCQGKGVKNESLPRKGCKGMAAMQGKGCHG